MYLRVGGIALSLLLCIASIFYLSSDFRKKLDGLAVANADSVQWALSQLEVELLALEVASQAAQSGEPGEITELRRRFDVFYSRVTTARESGVYAELRSDPDVAERIREASLFVNRNTSLIDGPDAELVAALPQLASEANALRSYVRGMSLKGLRHFAQISDRNRAQVADILTRIATLTASLVVTLIVLVIVLFRVNRENQRRATENQTVSSRLKAVIATSIDAIVVLDSKGHVIDFNGSAEQVFGYLRQDAVGLYIGKLLEPAKSEDPGVKCLQHYLKTGDGVFADRGLVQMDARRNDGALLPVEISISAVNSGARGVFVAFIRDISRRVEGEMALVAARDKAVEGEKAKAELLAVMSHEMRTPLNGMLGTLELLEDTDLTEQQITYADIMRTSGQLLLHHVNDVLDISRVDAGKMDIAHIPFDLNKMLGELVVSQKPLADTGGNTVNIEDHDTRLDLVIGDQVRIRQIVLNLLGNALKFTRGGKVCVSAQRLAEDNIVEIRVSDTGIGIAPDHIEKIFEDFVTLNAAYDRSTGGTGLGLGIARRLARAMGGDIVVTSKVGSGSTFRLSVPLEVPASAATIASAPKPEAEKAPARRQPPSTGLNVLVVEDNEINRIVVRSMLEKDGHRVTEAFDGKQGAEAAGREAFDLIFMDISMPGMDGVASTQAIRASGGPSGNTPIVALTAHALPDEIVRFKSAGINQTLIKPISRTALQDSIALAVSGPVQDVPVSTPATEDPPKLARESIGALLETLEPGHLTKLATEFIRETSAELARLQAQTVAERSDAQFAKDIHRLAGSAAVFGALHLRSVMTEIERLSRAGHTSAAETAFASLGPIWKETQTALQEAISETTT